MPGYQRFAARAPGSRLPSPIFARGRRPPFAAARAAFADTLDAWQHVQPIVFGPARTSSSDLAIELFRIRAARCRGR